MSSNATTAEITVEKLKRNYKIIQPFNTLFYFLMTIEYVLLAARWLCLWYCRVRETGWTRNGWKEDHLRLTEASELFTYPYSTLQSMENSGMIKHIGCR